MTAWLMDTVLYTGLLIALVLVLRRPVGRYFGPQIAYGLWALPFLRLLLPPVTLPASFAPETTPAPLAVEAAPAAGSALAEPAAATVASEAAAPVSQSATALAPPQVPAWEWSDLVAPLVSVWAGVALGFLIYRVVTYHRMRRELLQGARPVGEIGRIRLVETPALAAPVAFGVLDKVIALPPQFMAQHDIAARDLAIQHEFAHHKGHDLLANMAAQALLALHWFNPLAWYGWRAMRRDQEAACDARVVAGRGREERIRYAALIAGIATGPRSLDFKAALAAPMACPVLGERSIVHRLRSLSMSEMSRRRRILGRTLIATSVLALPLTASISYSAANAQAPEVPAFPAAPSAELPPAPPAPPAPPEAPEAGEREVRTFVVRRDGAGDGEPEVRGFTLRRDGNSEWTSPMPELPRMEFNSRGVPSDPEFEARMEEFGRKMEQWAEENGARWERWSEEQSEQALALAEQARRSAPEVVESCDEGEQARTTTEDGRRRIVICQRNIEFAARNGLRNARNSIARNTDISPEVRNEILQDLDEEIARIEREAD